MNDQRDTLQHNKAPRNDRAHLSSRLYISNNSMDSRAVFSSQPDWGLHGNDDTWTDSPQHLKQNRRGQLGIAAIMANIDISLSNDDQDQVWFNYNNYLACFN